ncbi:hypothetical protein [Alistipes sp.]|uniref:hypothetical protein n=1 Tax=Alistipes sp. TaxID=1872444 RepID=UPI003AF187B3
MRLRTILLAATLACRLPAGAAAPDDDFFWWPEQRSPARYTVCTSPRSPAEAVLAQSAAGLAARAVNEGRSKRMIWIARGGRYETWLRATARERRIRCNGETDVWSLVGQLRDEGLVSGYVLYAAQDGSLNPATVHAGQLGAVLIEQSLRPRAETAGLRQVYDARGERPAACLAQAGDSLGRDLIVVMNPSLPFNRDLAVAQRAMVYYGADSAYRAMLARTHPFSPVIGWNEGPESGHVGPPSEYGLFSTASDFCSNLPFLMAGARQAKIDRVRRIDPHTIDFAAPGSFHAFLMSDGDNMQWTMDVFFSRDYYLSPICERIPIGWTSCAANLSQASPATWNSLARQQPRNATIAEYSGGYQYADLFGRALPDRWEALRRYARMTGRHMRRTGVTVLHLMMLGPIDSPDAMRAYSIYAEEIDSLTGIVAIQYNPYHAGRGAVYWVRDRHGIELPVVTARYSLWGKIDRDGFGRPDQIARRIDADAAAGDALGWTIVHAWSRYKLREDGSIADADNDDPAAARGAAAVAWCADRIGPATRIVPLEELLWRIRMRHDPAATRKVIETIDRP